MAKLHTGKTELPGTMTFMADGYWFKAADDDQYRRITYPEPRPMVRDIKSMWGVSIGGWFAGVIRAKGQK